jgi:hypothetical protein
MNLTLEQREDGDTLISCVLTLRDYFAAKSINECIRVAADQTEDGEPLSKLFAKAATFSYALADAMLKARTAL